MSNDSNHINKIINDETFNSFPDLFSANRQYIKHLNSTFNGRKYFYVIWNLLHLITTLYPDEPTEQQQNSMIEFIKKIPSFSCTSCGNTYHEKLDENIIYKAIKCKNNLIQFMIDYHNTVNSTNRIINVKKDTNIYNVEIIIQKYYNNDYIIFFRNEYDIDIEYMINNNCLNLLYDKLEAIRSKIYDKVNIELIFNYKLI